MEVNYKGALNVFAQKKGWNLPHYTTKRVDGEDHQPIFECVVSVHGMISRENRGASKKKAEQVAAESLYRALHTTGSSPITTEKTLNPEKVKVEISIASTEFKIPDLPSPENVTHVMMIDGENLQTLVHDIAPQEDIQLIVYFSKNHHLARSKLKSYIIKRISPCTRADGCDIFMAMDIMTLPSEFPNVEEITVFSRDKFAAAVADNAPAFWNGIYVHHEVDVGNQE